MPLTRRDVEAGGLGRGQVAGDQDALGDRLLVRAAGEHPAYLLTHRVYVGGSLAQVGVGQLGPLLLDVGEAAGPGNDRPRRPY